MEQQQQAPSNDTADDDKEEEDDGEHEEDWSEADKRQKTEESSSSEKDAAAAASLEAKRAYNRVNAARARQRVKNHQSELCQKVNDLVEKNENLEKMNQDLKTKIATLTDENSTLRRLILNRDSMKTAGGEMKMPLFSTSSAPLGPGMEANPSALTQHQQALLQLMSSRVPDQAPVLDPDLAATTTSAAAPPMHHSFPYQPSSAASQTSMTQQLFLARDNETQAGLLSGPLSGILSLQQLNDRSNQNEQIQRQLLGSNLTLSPQQLPPTRGGGTSAPTWNSAMLSSSNEDDNQDALLASLRSRRDQDSQNPPGYGGQR